MRIPLFEIFALWIIYVCCISLSFSFPDNEPLDPGWISKEAITEDVAVL